MTEEEEDRQVEEAGRFVDQMWSDFWESPEAFNKAINAAGPAYIKSITAGRCYLRSTYDHNYDAWLDYLKSEAEPFEWYEDPEILRYAVRIIGYYRQNGKKKKRGI